MLWTPLCDDRRVSRLVPDKKPGLPFLGSPLWNRGSAGALLSDVKTIALDGVGDRVLGRLSEH